MGIHPTPISVPPWAVLGYRADGRPIRPIAGGAEDDEPDIDIEVDDDPAGDEPDPQEQPDEGDPKPAGDKPKPKPPAKSAEPEGEWKPPSKDEWERTTRALKKANDDGKRHRLALKEREEKDRESETEHEKALRVAREEGEKRYRAPLVRTAVRGALIEAGALAFLAEEDNPNSREAKEKGESRLTRLMKLVDSDALDVDDDGTVSGLESAVDDLRRDYPELFAAPAPRRPKPRPNAAPRQPAPDKPKTSWERHAAAILGKA